MATSKPQTSTSGSRCREPVFIFVYGSLKQHFGNNKWLFNSPCLGRYSTLKNNYSMVSLGNFPGVIPGGKYKILGEIYEIDYEILSELDFLEGNGIFYKRKKIQIERFNKKVYMYELIAPYKETRKSFSYGGYFNSIEEYEREISYIDTNKIIILDNDILCWIGNSDSPQDELISFYDRRSYDDRRAIPRSSFSRRH